MGNFYSSVCPKLSLWALVTLQWREKAWVAASRGIFGMGSGKYRLKYFNFQSTFPRSLIKTDKTSWAHTRGLSLRHTATIQVPHAGGTFVCIFRREWPPEVIGLTWGHTARRHGAMLPGRLVLHSLTLNHHLVRVPYFGGENEGDHALGSIYIWTEQ